MINSIEITNFKSIKYLKRDCKRVNIFIGEPNTGKSNILEALGILSYGYYHAYGGFRDFVRYERTSNLFYDEVLGDNITIASDICHLRIQFENGRFMGKIFEGDHERVQLQGGYDDFHVTHDRGPGARLPVKFYSFVVQDRFDRLESEFLLPPHGRNLLSLLLTNKELRLAANRLFSNFRLRLVLEPQENKIKVQKQLEDIIVSYPYSLSSDTIQRVVFFLSAVLSNKESILIFQEPESHAFPYYTKYIAEIIALDEGNNQYFVSTHNPYFLLPILEKSPKEDVAVFITYFEDYQTKTKPLSLEEMEEIMEIDVFSNLDRYLERK